MIIQNIDTVTLVTAIKTAVSTLSPLSIVRCGDGEMHILKNKTDFTGTRELVHHHSLCLIQFRENIWTCSKHSSVENKPTACECYLDNNKSLKWRSLAREIISYSIKNSDYVGLTVPGKNANYYSISKDILKRYNIDSTKLKTISSLFPREESFGSLKSFKEIIQGNAVHFVTSNVQRFKDNKIHELLGVKVTYTDISGNPVMADTTILERIKKDIINTTAPIILFGGGYGVKSLIPWSAKELGKISIDAGSVLDAWSGYQSRHMFLENQYHYLNWVK